MSQDGKQQDQPINWLVVVVFGLFHIGAVASLFMFSWQALVGCGSDPLLDRRQSGHRHGIPPALDASRL